MTIALPLPYDDELLYNNIGRYMEQTSVENPTTVIRALFGRLVYPTGDLLCGLAEFERQTYDCWGLSAQEIANKYTLLPYYTSYATQHRRSAAYTAAVGEGGARPSAFLGLTASQVDKPMTFRFCEQCAREDVAKFGETYWRRSHQLPGVVCCPRHQVVLRNSVASMTPRSSTEWYPGNAVILKALDNEAGQQVLWDGNPNVLEVVRRSVDLLSCDDTRFVSSMSERYYSLALQGGLTKLSGVVDADFIRQEITTLYGADYLNAVGLSVQASPKQSWPVAMMQRARASFQPLQHVILGHFLEVCGTQRMGKAQQAPLTARLPFTCPNPYASHAMAHLIERVKVEEKDGERIGRGYCSCGLKFSFRRYRPGNMEPEIAAIFAFGKDWCETAKTMRKAGMSLADIAREMEVSRHSVKAMLKPRELPDVRAIKVNVPQWRRQWKALLDSVAPGGHKAAKARNERLYYLMNKYDRAWLRKSAKRFIQARNASSKNIRADWASRDIAWSTALQSAAEKLYAAAPILIRASRTAIIAEADVYDLKSDVLSHLPLCRAVLSALEESTESFQIRRLEWGAKNEFEEGEPVVPWKLLKRVNIPMSRMTPLLKSAVDRLSHAPHD